ncbi:hypothetical protein LJC71_10265 [Desulfosarcina sp. OttesenSCG-928-A07]|nr:hypothetical protein [Desulfosarcina sp. OttesenSCG-928-G17]MDL2330104.1 hypothetical protein [Desulfosarcina sp. OttesenSCG-928-A07]
MKQRAEALTFLLNSVAVFFLVTLLISCATGNRVYFAGSNDIGRQFETAAVVLPEYRYYYGGPKAKPNAIVAIREDYELASPHWHPLDHLSAESLKKLVQTIIFVPGIEYKTSPNGAWIVALGGDRVGLWYSAFEYPVIRLTGEKQLYIADPLPRLPTDTLVRMKDD